MYIKEDCLLQSFKARKKHNLTLISNCAGSCGEEIPSKTVAHLIYMLLRLDPILNHSCFFREGTGELENQIRGGDFYNLIRCNYLSKPIYSLSSGNISNYLTIKMFVGDNSENFVTTLPQIFLTEN